MNMREAFYAERDRRTVSYGVGAGVLGRPVGIAVAPDAADSRAGQAGALALVNMVARIHRRLRLWVPEAPLLARSLVPAGDLAEACAATARAIDPYIKLEINGRRSEDSEGVPVLGLGRNAHDGCVAFLSADGFVGRVDREPRAFSPHPTSILGAALASCLAAAELLRAVLGLDVRARSGSLWGFREGHGDSGPEIDPGPLDVGDVAVIGAGAVASALAYWLREIGITGDWVFVDGDYAELHNTNRTIGLLAVHAGWPDGRPGGAAVPKAAAAADLLGARHFVGWYHEWLDIEATARPDLVLPLANDFEVRHAIGQRGETILLHATTSTSWTAELHRHIPDRDGCIDCRFPPDSQVRFECSTGRLATPDDAGSAGNGNADAALPFLSAAAGLLLAAGLLQLQHGELLGETRNHWRLLFRETQGLWSRSTWRCAEVCRQQLPRAVRDKVNLGRRWARVR